MLFATEFSRAVLAPVSVVAGCPCAVVEDVFEDFERPDDVGLDGQTGARQIFEIGAIRAL